MVLIHIFSVNHKVLSLCCCSVKHRSAIVSVSNSNSMRLMQLVQNHPFSRNPKVPYSLSSSCVLQPLTRFPRYGRKGASKCGINLVMNISGQRAVIRQNNQENIFGRGLRSREFLFLYGMQEAYIFWQSAIERTQNMSLELIKLN